MSFVTMMSMPAISSCICGSSPWLVVEGLFLSLDWVILPCKEEPMLLVWCLLIDTDFVFIDIFVGVYPVLRVTFLAYNADLF